MDEKFNGTKNNSIGPGQYNVIISPRKRLIIDWSKLSEDKKLKGKKNFKNKDIKEIKLNLLDNLYLRTNILNEKKDDNNGKNINLKNNNYNNNRRANIDNIKNKIVVNNNVLKNFKNSDDYINLTALNYIKQKKEEKSLIGPGSYNYFDEFLIIPKKNKYQNFGSSVSRDLMSYSPKKEKNKSFDKFIKYFCFSNENKENKKYQNKRIYNDKIALYKNSSLFTEKTKIKMLREKHIKK